LREVTAGLRFDFFAWEVQALAVKVAFEIAAPQDTLRMEQRHRLVMDYFDVLQRVRFLEWELKGIYARLEGQEAAREAAPREAELGERRAWLCARQDLVEGILEEEVSTELEAEGFGVWGYVWPPIKVRFTELPLLLVVSSRSAITRDADVDLKAGLSLPEREALEERVDATFPTKRSLVTPIGGLSAYPAMILESDSLVWLSDTFAHEWTHHFMALFPAGLNYRSSGEMISVNETTANIVGREVGRRVIQRYYPELSDRLPPLPEPPTSPPRSAAEIVWPKEPPPGVFDYDREMRRTRLRVDELLAEGKVEEVEAYMEERRLLFVEQGHNLRKLNQAYFAFYGSYATNPSTGNPIGGQLEWLRAQSPSLRAFLLQVSSFSRYEDLLATLPHEADGPPS